MELSKIKETIFQVGTHSLSRKTVGKVPQDYVLNIGDFENDIDLDPLFNELIDADYNDNLFIYIHSNGGLLTELQRFEQVINDKFYGRTTTFLNPHGYSAGAFMFLLGDSRIVFENSSFMIHNFSSGIYGKANEMEAQHKFDSNFYKKYYKNILGPYVTEAEFDDLIKGQDFWFDSDEMLKRGIATDIVYKGQLLKAKEYLKIQESPEAKIGFFNELVKNDVLSSRDRELITYELKNMPDFNIDDDGNVKMKSDTSVNSKAKKAKK